MITFEKTGNLKYTVKSACDRRHNTPKDRDSGFTLLEVVVAVVMMGMAYVVILQSFSLSSRNIAKVEKMRDKFLKYSLQFEQQGLDRRLAAGESEAMNEDIFIKGSRYNLLLVSDESETLMTLRLEKL